VYGTADNFAPVSRADFERALRSLNASDLDIRDALLKLAAHVISLTDELTRRIDKVEPLPSPPNTPAEEPTHTVEQMVSALIPSTLDQIRAQDIISSQRVAIDVGESKYDAEVEGPPCLELLHICKASSANARATANASTTRPRLAAARCTSTARAYAACTTAATMNAFGSTTRIASSPH